MSEPTSDTIDFKPFFDMVVGILFILLILIAAQLFFTRFETDSPEAQAQQKRAMRLAEQELFLNSVAANLTKSGFVPVVDRVANRVSIPLVSISAMTTPDQTSIWSAPDQSKVARFAQNVFDATACTSLALDRICARRFDLSFAQIGFDLTLGGLKAGVTPEPSAQILALQLSAAVFAVMPNALAWNGYQGTALFGRTVTITPATFVAGASTLAVEFTFAP